MAAWVFLAVAEFGGLWVANSHHGLAADSHSPWLVSLLIFVLLWTIMIVAMMLPANIPILDAMPSLRTGEGSRFLATASFLAGYAAIWIAFGAAAFVGDNAVHSLTNQWHWFHERQWLILPATLAVVGFFQLVPAKRRHLEQCRHQAEHISRHPDETWAGILTQGLRYGRCELSCCWGLMLLMIALGHGLLWMLLLGGVMLCEKYLSRGIALAQISGAVLLVSSSVLTLRILWS